MPNGPYSAGTAYLTVVPSFLGIEDAFKKAVRDLAASADKDIAAGVARGLDEANKAAKDKGAKGGRDYAGAYETEAKRALTKAWQSLPEPQPDVDLRKWDKKLAGVRSQMKELSQQRIGIDIDRDTFDRAIADFRDKLQQLRDTAGGKNKEIQFFNADQADRELAEFQKFADDAARLAGDGGEQVGSAFNQRMARVLREGIGKLPPIKLSADSSDAEEKIAELRARLVDLQNKKIGVDIDAGAAYAELRAIVTELNALDRRDVRVDIRTNAHEAAAGMSAFVEQAEQAGEATGNIGNRAQFTLSRLEYMIALGVSLGSALVPAAAAAAGAVGLIGTAAIGAASGIGVFALGISGVSDAVKALDQYQNDQAKSAKSVNDANRSMASSTDQVRTAQMSLVNTRRNVAEAAEDAARRVSDAERSVGEARQQAAQDQIEAQRAVADARKSVADAEKDVGDARRQAATDIAEANRQVRDAQEGVTDAESDALDVRKALNDAIAEAVENMAELDVKLSRNQVDQNKSVTAQMKALEELNKLKTNPRATEVELRQAQDAYDEQTQRIKELQQDQKELAADKQKYDKEGVEGDAQVIAARKRIADADKSVATARERLAREEQQRTETTYRANERIADAQDRVAKAQESVAKAQQAQRDTEVRSQKRIADAERSVSDARRQQARQAQDGQYSLAQAAQAVTAAQRSQQAAWEKTGTAGGDALDTLNEKMGNLSPAAQHFAKFLFGLKDEFLDLRAAAAEPLLPRLEEAINLLLPYLPSVEKFIGKIATALGDVAINAVQAFGDPTWQRFFRFVDESAVPAITTLYDVGQNLTQGLINLFLALTPFNQDVGEGLVKLSEDFAVWAERLDKTQGYQDFLDYVRENGPRVVHFLGEVGELLIDLVKATAPLGSVALRVLTVFVDILNSIPTGPLTLLVGGIAAVSFLMSGLGGILRIFKFKDQLTDIFGPKQAKFIQTYAINTGRATDETGRFGKATAAAGGYAAAARDRMSSFATAVGQVPGRVSNAITSITPLGTAMDRVRVTSLEAAAAVNGPGGVAAAVQSAQGHIAGLTGAAEIAARTGVGRLRTSLTDIAVAANGPGGLAAGVQDAAGKLGDLAKSAGGAATSIGKKLMGAGSSLVGFLGGPWGVALTAATAAVGYFATKSSEQKAKVDTLKTALGDLSDTYSDLAATGDEAGTSADEAFTNIVKNNPELQKAVIQLDKLGISFNEMVKAAASGDPSAVLGKLNEEIERNTKLSEEFDRRNAAARGAYGENPYKGQIDGLKQVRDAFQQNATAMGQASQATEILSTKTERNRAVTAIQGDVTKDVTGKQIDLINTYDRNATAIDALNGLVTTYTDLQSTAKDRADAVRTAIENQTGAATDQIEADETLAQKTMALRDQVNQAKDAHDKNATSLSLNTAQGLRNRDALEDVAGSIRNMYIQDIAAGKPIADVTKAHGNRITALKDEAKHLGLDKTATQELIDKYGDVPKTVKTTVSMDQNSFQTVYRDLQRAQFMQMELRLGRDPNRAEQDWQEFLREQGRALGRAEGGPIVGPGTGTSDSVLMWGSNGEWVHKTAAVNYYGDASMAAINNMEIPRENLLPRRATGGPVSAQRDLPAYATGGKVNTNTWPMKVDVSHTWVPTAAWIRANTEIPNAEDGTFTGLSSVATVAAMQKFALAQRGKRYLWGAVGPNVYDCSGLVGDLYAIATGRKLYRRYMATSDMGPGKHGMVAGPGKYFTVYLGPGHTAANVGGLHAEAYGGNGTPLAIGRIGTRLSYYNQKLHLPGFATGGQVDVSKLETKQERMLSFLRYGWPEPPAGVSMDDLLQSQMAGKQFDAGGWLPPGYSTVVNNTGSPEPVLTSQQWRDISDLAQAAAGNRGGGNTYVFPFRDTTLTMERLRQLQDQEAALARDGRAR